MTKTITETAVQAQIRMGDMVIYHHEHTNARSFYRKSEQKWMVDYPAIVAYLRDGGAVDLIVFGLSAPSGWQDADWQPETGNDVGGHTHDVPVCEVREAKEGTGKGEWSRR